MTVPLIAQPDVKAIRHASQAYQESVAEQERLVDSLIRGVASPCLIFTEHPPVYTIGTSGAEQDVLKRRVGGADIDVVHTGRGGEVTYHGPGQLVCYVLADLRQEQDLRRHVWRLEEWIIRALTHFGIVASRSRRGIGVWVREEKIAAVGVRCRKWITYHGVALNIHPNLSHFGGIVPCGMKDGRVTSMHAQGVRVLRSDVEVVLLAHVAELFGPTLMS